MNKQTLLISPLLILAIPLFSFNSAVDLNNPHKATQENISQTVLAVPIKAATLSTSGDSLTLPPVPPPSVQKNNASMKRDAIIMAAAVAKSKRGTHLLPTVKMAQKQSGSSAKAQKPIFTDNSKPILCCNLCPTEAGRLKRWTTPYKLKRHQFIHTNEKPFKCKICSQRYNQKSSAKTHLTAKYHVKDTEDAIRTLLSLPKDTDVSHCLADGFLDNCIEEETL